MAVYEEPRQLSREELVQKFLSEKNNEICGALLSMSFYDDDWKWCQEQCLYFLEHSDPNVRGVAANCLGHIARIHQSLDRKRVEDALSEHLKDKEISGIIEDALDDIKMFIV
ncbi:MAG: hypothetical protein H0V82_07100 [Candidatus Protochlamydia sp.]|nr:hypothetical protein [Candidatus Protochlamydia sp.]